MRGVKIRMYELEIAENCRDVEFEALAGSIDKRPLKY